VRRRVAALHPLVVALAEELTAGVEEGSPDRDPALGVAGPRLGDGHVEHCLVIGHGARSY
jgi:hypothetical protein